MGLVQMPSKEPNEKPRGRQHEMPSEVLNHIDMEKTEFCLKYGNFLRLLRQIKCTEKIRFS